MLRSCSRLSAIIVITAAELVVAACGSTWSSNNPPRSSNSPTSSTASKSSKNSSPSATTTYFSARATVIGKTTDVAVNPAVMAALKHVGITLIAVAPATAKTTLLFPVTGGQIVVATLAGTVDHTGGLTFSHGGKSIRLANFVINTNTRQLTATVGGESMAIFDLDLASPTRVGGPHGTVVACAIKLTVTSQGATALNSGLGVRTFKAGMGFGVATLTVAYARGHR